ncbi:phage holin family protein [Phenylobacterium sp.]|uniref:phage holin family protein n=1 Tax=Phenylobacterium sp. TaxID=1871053 RepID=UPI00286D76E4|nr:phage holin family protein [Phenylobacterium sp.]
MADPEARSIPQLLGDFTSDLTTLLRQESELVRAEFSEKLGVLGRAGGELAGGAILLLAALMVLLQALVLALSNIMDPAWAALLVGVVVAIVGVVLLRAGASLAKPINLTPDRTLRQVGKDAELAKDQVT